MNSTISSRYMEHIGKHCRLYFNYRPLLSRIRNLEHKAVVQIPWASCGKY
jgi:hypothetical protein